MEPLIKIQDMYKIYHIGDNEIRAIDGVNVSIEMGEYVAIVGQSGSGKSTLMNMIGCLDVPTSGLYQFCGYDTSKLSDNSLSEIRNREIGFVFQGFNLIPSLTAYENVELPLIYRGVGSRDRRKLALDAINKVGLSDRMHHMPTQMSGGQQQRIAIARAIVAGPKLILADEPTGNLDSRSSTEIMKLFELLNKSGRTVVLVTHDMNVAEMANRVIEIHDGEIVRDYVRNK